MSGRWAGSDRTQRLPPNWAALCAHVKARDGQQCTVLEDGHRCTGPADQVDHNKRGDDHHPDNLGSMCNHHHAIKSSREGNAVRWRHRQRRAPEPHPGLMR